MPIERPPAYHTLDGAAQLLADAIIDGYSDAAGDLDLATSDRELFPRQLAEVATIAAKALTAAVEVLAEDIGQLDDLVLVSSRQWAEQCTLVDTIRDDIETTRRLLGIPDAAYVDSRLDDLERRVGVATSMADRRDGAYPPGAMG